MKIRILSIGKSKNGPEGDLFALYKNRLPKDALELVEIRNQRTAVLEGEELLKRIAPEDVVVALDERGDDLTTQEFAAFVEGLIQDACKTLVFVIGGADGLDEAVKARSNRMIRFGRMTWPHFLVRGLLAEQLYRIQKIRDGHPYHRD